MIYFYEDFQYPNTEVSIEMADLQHELSQDWEAIFLERITITWKDRINQLLVA